MDKLILPAIGIGLALLAYQFFQGIKAEVRYKVMDMIDVAHVHPCQTYKWIFPTTTDDWVDIGRKSQHGG